MARLKLWRVAFLLAVAAVLLNIAGAVLVARWSPMPLNFRTSVQHAVRNAREQTVLASMLDSLARAPLRRETIAGVTLAFPRDTTGIAVDRAREAIRLEASSVPASAGVPWATVLLRAHSRKPSTMGGDLSVAGQWHPCISLPVAGLDRAVERDHSPAVLGECVFSAFGAPGPAVSAWLQQVSYRPGRSAIAPSGRETDGRVILDMLEQQRFFSSFDETSIRWFGCRSGDAEACRAVLAIPVGSNFRGDLLWWLHEKYGNEAFTRFWTAKGTIDQAAVAGFGRPLATLASDHLRQHLVVINNGPLPPVGWPIASVATIVLMLGAALGLGRLRTVA